MNSSVKGLLVRQAVFLLVALGIAFLTALYEHHAMQDFLSGSARLISDGAFVSAVLFLSIGALLFISHWGGFDSFGYVISRFKGKTTVSYFDYVRERHAGKKAPSALFLTTGGIMLLVSVCAACIAG